MRKGFCLILLVLVLLLTACSGGNSDAPSDRDAHPSGWLVTHDTESLLSSGFVDCVGCHGADLGGSGEAVSCYSCHSFNESPPFSVHPTDWTEPYSDHRPYAAINGFASCAGCHGQDLRGRQDVPSCYSSSLDSVACHSDGPGEIPHPIDDVAFRNGGHGSSAKADLTACQACHGELGGPGSNPRFNIGFGVNGCEDCHSTNLAHPQSWAAHNSAGNILNACTLCHGVDLDGVGLSDTEAVGVSCLDCHTVNPGLNPTDCVSCHNTPPDSSLPSGAVSPNLAGAHNRVGHTIAISTIPAETCDRCHSEAGSGTVNHFDLFRPADVNLPLPLDTITPASDGTNTTCNGSCHFEGADVQHINSSWY